MSNIIDFNNTKKDKPLTEEDKKDQYTEFVATKIHSCFVDIIKSTQEYAKENKLSIFDLFSTIGYAQGYSMQQLIFETVNYENQQQIQKAIGNYLRLEPCLLTGLTHYTIQMLDELNQLNRTNK